MRVVGIDPGLSGDDFTIRLADHSDIPYVMALQRKNRESVGGLPEPAISERVARRTLLLGLINGDPCGYLLYDRRGAIVRVPQACIQYDARRRTYSSRLVGSMLALHADATEIRLRCAADIDANLFWRSLGFHCTSVSMGGARRGRLINTWQLWLDDRLITSADIARTPAWQRRIDCKDEQTGFIDEAPEGFTDAGPLPKLAWANRP